MRISVIMPVYLGGYEGYGHPSASDPEGKFIRAVLSFVHQSLSGNELIIISDGCDKAESIFNNEFSSHPKIKFKKIRKQPPFGGMVRQTGIDMAKGEIICYLDHDDEFGWNHLEIINDNFEGQWVYYNDFVIKNAEHTEMDERNNIPSLGRIGTSSIAHRKDVNVVWCDGYEHDWKMISEYLLPLPVKKISTPQYFVCHIPGVIDF